MNKLNHERPVYSGDNTFALTLIIVVILTALGAGFFYWNYIPQKQQQPQRSQDAYKKQDYTPVYGQLGISPLPTNIERLPQIQSRLDQLKREACYRDAVAGLSEALLKAGYPRESATSLRTFVKRCRNSEGLLQLAYDVLERISDFDGALDVADQLVKAYPANGTFRYWRATAYDHLNDFSPALIDYINTIQLANDPKRLIGDVFYNLSRMYAELGRYCDAITPMETYISLDPADRRTPKTTSIIAEYAEKGNCDTRYASGAARVSIPGTSSVRLLLVVVNGVAGNFILDTGATFVAVTSQFASRAGVSTEPTNQIVLKTVGGTALAEIGYANMVSVGKAEARGVVLAVHRASVNPFGDKIDGLLGMSFLARFKLNVSPTQIELTPIPLR
jgi:clan AA aspartic protease (TIGR02281 family)